MLGGLCDMPAINPRGSKSPKAGFAAVTTTATVGGLKHRHLVPVEQHRGLSHPVAGRVGARPLRAGGSGGLAAPAGPGLAVPPPSVPRVSGRAPGGAQTHFLNPAAAAGRAGRAGGGRCESWAAPEGRPPLAWAERAHGPLDGLPQFPLAAGRRWRSALRVAGWTPGPWDLRGHVPCSCGHSAVFPGDRQSDTLLSAQFILW